MGPTHGDHLVLLERHPEQLLELLLAQVPLLFVWLDTLEEFILELFVREFGRVGVFKTFKRHILLGLGRRNLLLNLLVYNCILSSVEVFKEGNKQRVLNTLGDASDGGSLRLLHGFFVFDGDLHASVLLVGACVVALPNVDFVVKLENVGIVVFEQGASEGALLDLISQHFAVGIFSHVPQAVHHPFLFRGFGLLFSGASRLHISSGAREEGPKIFLKIATHSLGEVHLSVRLHLAVLEVLREVGSRVPLVNACLFALPNVNVLAHVQHEAVRVVHQLCLHLNGEHSWVAVTVNAHQLGHVFGRYVVD